jgi:putative aldouronate transport system substrate-binding protein
MKNTSVLFILFLLPALVFAGGGTQRQSDVGGASVKPTELKVEVFDRGTDGGKSDPTNNNWTKWIQEKILKDENIALTFVRLPRTEETTGLNNMMAAGNAPDLVFTYNNGLISNYQMQGGVFNMSPYTGTVLKDLKDFLGPDAATGKDLIRRYEVSPTELYTIPAKRVDTGMTIGFIRKDWLDKLGLPVPQTTQQYYEALRAFKEKDPGNVGKDKVVPLTLTTSNEQSLAVIYESFIDPNLSLKDRYIYDAARNITAPGFKEGFRFLNKLYNEGLLDRDFPLYPDDNPWKNIIKSGVVGSFTALWQRPYMTDARIVPMLKENVPDAEVIPIDCFLDANGKSTKVSYDITGILFFIPSFSKAADAAMRYMNWLAKFENYNFLQIGPEGVTHEIVDGVPKIIPATGLWIQNSDKNSDYTINLNGLYLGDPVKEAKAASFAFPDASPEWVVNSRTISLTNARPRIFKLTPARPTPSYSQTLSDKWRALFSASIIAKTADFDKVWDAGVADYLASGGQQEMDIARRNWGD